MAGPVESIVVAAAVVERDGAFLVTRRLEGTHLAGRWEFPGGKQMPDETLEACLVREVREELACAVEVGECLVSTSHLYPERKVTLHFFACRLLGEPVPQDGQAMRWVPRHALRDLDLPEADRELVELLVAGAAPRSPDA
jgi:mutator protein MutT